MSNNLQQPKKIPTLWFRNEKEKESIEHLLRNNTVLITRLREILKERLDSLDVNETKKDRYSDPSWAYQQADTLGAKRELKFLLSIFDFIK